MFRKILFFITDKKSSRAHGRIQVMRGPGRIPSWGPLNYCHEEKMEKRWSNCAKPKMAILTL